MTFENNIRFNLNANSFEAAVAYFKNRSIQLRPDNICLDEENLPYDLGWGCHAVFKNYVFDKYYQSVYVYLDHRGKGHLKEWASTTTDPFITSPGCGLEEYFKSHQFPYLLAGRHTLAPEYKAIEMAYRNMRAKRTGVFYMNHIDEGLTVLKQIGASENAQRAFCLHPIFQKDEDLKEQYGLFETYNISSIPLLLAMEYRSVANEYLAHRTDIRNPTQIRLSPLEEVNDMLRADKVQNYKDFLVYHSKTHPRKKQLDFYFQLWLERLEISTSHFKSLKEILEKI